VIEPQKRLSSESRDGGVMKGLVLAGLGRYERFERSGWLTFVALAGLWLARLA
jgi:hypothetical protein